MRRFLNKLFGSNSSRARLRTHQVRRSLIERLEHREVFAASISEVLISPAGGDFDTDQYVELRGNPNEAIPSGTYFVVVGGSSNPVTGSGRVQSTIDLSGLNFGSNGFLSISQFGNPYQVSNESASLASTSGGFSGLPNGRWAKDVNDTGRLVFEDEVANFFLIESTSTPALGSDVDTDDDGALDGDAASWNVLDSVAIVNAVTPSTHSYSKITFASSNQIAHPALTEVVLSNGGGYLARLGASTGSQSTDWFQAGVLDDASQAGTQYRIQAFGKGRPTMPELAGRALNNLGTFNFVGGIAGKVAFDSNHDALIGSGDTPIANAPVFADQNGDGLRNDASITVTTADIASGTEITNLVPNATLTVVNSSNANTAEVARVALEPTIRTQRFASHENSTIFDSSTRLKSTFYNQVKAVSIDALGGDLFADSFVRLEAYDANGALLEFALSNALRSGQSKTISIQRSSADIKFVVAFVDDTIDKSSPTARFTGLSFTFPELTAVSNAQGDYVLDGIPASDYVVQVDDANIDKVRLENFDRIPFQVTNSEHRYGADFGFRDNQAPIVNGLSFSVAENPLLNAIVGQVNAHDPDPGQAVSFQFLTDAGPFGIEAATGKILVANSKPWDFETSPPLTVELLVTDSFKTPSSTKVTITITATDVNEGPTAVRFDTITSKVVESSDPSPGFAVANVLVDDDALGTNTLSLTGVDAASFELNGNQLRVKAGVVFNYVTKSEYSVTVRAVDAAVPGSGVEKIFLLQVLNHPEVVSVTDLSGNALSSHVNGLRVTWDSIVTLGQNAIQLIKVDIANKPIPITISESVVNNRTVADIVASSPFGVAGGLIDGTYKLLVDGHLVTFGADKTEGIDFATQPFTVRADALPGIVTVIAPTSLYSGQVYSMTLGLTGVVVPVGDQVAYSVDFDGDGVFDQVFLGDSSLLIGGLRFTSGGSFTVHVLASLNNASAGTGDLVVDVSPAKSATEDWTSAYDVDRDSFVAPLDVLIVINYINRFSEGAIPYSLSMDSDRDGSVAPLDVLVIINYINNGINNAPPPFLTLHQANSGVVHGLTNDMLISGEIDGSSRKLLVSIDGQPRVDASSAVDNDGKFSINDAALLSLLGSVSDGQHIISVSTETSGTRSVTMDKVFVRMTHLLQDFQILSAMPAGNDVELKWSSAGSGARYRVFATIALVSEPVLLATTDSTHANIQVPQGAVTIFVEATDGAMNTRVSSVLTL